MRRFWTFAVPFGAAVLAGTLFAAGFYMVLSGRLGTPVAASSGSQGGDRQPTQRLSILFLGDSLARGTGDATGLGMAGALDSELSSLRLPHDPPVNLAVNGARTPDLVRLVDLKNVQAIVRSSNVIVVSIGGNDLFGAMGAEARAPRDPDAVMSQVIEGVAEVLQRLRRDNPTARIFLIGLYNPFALQPEGRKLDAAVERWNGRLLDRFGGDSQITVVPTFDLFSHRQRLSADRFHPGHDGYILIARRIAESL